MTDDAAPKKGKAKRAAAGRGHCRVPPPPEGATPLTRHGPPPPPCIDSDIVRLLLIYGFACAIIVFSCRLALGYWQIGVVIALLSTIWSVMRANKDVERRVCR